MAGVGDFNGDGVDDLAAGEPNSLKNSRAFIFYGSKTPPSSIDVRTRSWRGVEIRGEGVRMLGRSVVPLGDITRDGRADVAFGSSDNVCVVPGRKSVARRVPLERVCTIEFVGSGRGFFGDYVAVGNLFGDRRLEIVMGESNMGESKTSRISAVTLRP